MISSTYILAIDQSTAATKVYLLDAAGKITGRFSKPHQQFYPKPGYVEHDAEEIWRNLVHGIRAVSQNRQRITGIALTNQRETTVFWDRDNGKPLCPAIVWQDVRGEYLCGELAEHAGRVRQLTGLTLSAYFPAVKAAAKFREAPELLRLAEEGRLCVGTIDSYLLFRLTGGRVFATDVSNASRTLLMNLHTLDFSPELCSLFGIPIRCLPKILPSDALFGQVELGDRGPVPIHAVMGDSHAALYGQGCHEAGMVKATFGTGSSVMMNIGRMPILSQNGLSTSVGYSYGKQTCYVLEGNVTSSGDALRWLVEEAGLAHDLAEVEAVARDTPDTGGVYLVPAFSGLGAPHNKPSARATISGLSRGSTRRHILRAALESIAYQDADIIQAMQQDTGSRVVELRVDGGPTSNSVLMQFLADLVGCNVQTAINNELSALGAGYMAGRALGVYSPEISVGQGKRYTASQNEAWRRDKLQGWHAAIHRSVDI
ncbi:MAG: FGGY-family carbohydrate kinase [Christensenellales bacterium]